MNTTIFPGGLRDLDKVVLDPSREQLLADSSQRCGGAAPWRQRKVAEFRTFLRLTMLSRRLHLLQADLELDLRIVFSLFAPVPCVPDSCQRLRQADFAVVALRYTEEATRLPQPGHGFIRILAPVGVFHSNLSPETQHLCLGAKLPAGIRITELVLLTYGALTLQNVVLDVLNPAGLLNRAAAEYLQSHPEHVPLTRQPFLDIA